MEFIHLTDKQIDALKKSITYDSSGDPNGAQGKSLANLLENSFSGKIPKIIGLTKKKINCYQIIASEDYKALYNQMQRNRFKSLFSKLKKAGYKGINEEGMKSYANMTEVQMWNYFSSIRDDINIFS